MWRIACRICGRACWSPRSPARSAPLASLGADGPRVLEGFAQQLGLGVTPLCWHTNRGRMAEAGAWLVQLTGALAKMATDVVHLASTEVGEVAEPHMPGRGGSSAMPHKRNPVGCTVILAAHAAAKGHASTLFEAMAAAHERPGRALARRMERPALVVRSGVGRAAGGTDAGRGPRRRCGPDAREHRPDPWPAVRRRGGRRASAPKLGREAAHRLVEQAAEQVRQERRQLGDVLARNQAARDAGVDLTGAFDLTPAVAAAARWVDPALRHAATIRARLASQDQHATINNRRFR